MTTATMEPTYSSPRRRHEGMNWRLIGFLAVVSIPFLWVLYVFVDDAIHGGVNDHGSYVQVDLKSMGNFDFDAKHGTKMEIPQRFRELDGRRTMLQGVMYTGNDAGDKVQEFQLVYDIQKCCFNGPPRVQERVFVKAPRDRPVPYYPSKVEITGIMRVDIQRDPGGPAKTVYVMDVESVKPL